MALPGSRGDREYQKFVDTAEGPAIRTTASVNVDNISLKSEMKVDSGHDLYLAENVSRTGDLSVDFNPIPSTFTLAELQGVENKTKGYVYKTKGATLTATSIELDASAQSDGYPKIEAGDVIEVVYRGESRFDSFKFDGDDLKIKGNVTTDVETGLAKEDTLTKLTAKLNETNLDGVTSDTDGDSVDVSDYSKKTIVVDVPVNTGAVTVNIQVSHNSTDWMLWNTETYTGTTALEYHEMNGYFPFVRVQTESQTDATVNAYIFGRGV